MTDILQPVSAVLLVLGLLGGALLFLRSRGVASFRSQTAQKRMKIVERLPLGAQHALHLVQVGDRLLLVSTSPGTCQIVDSTLREISE